MAKSLADLDLSIVAAKAAADAFIASHPPVEPIDLSPQVAAVDAITSELGGAPPA